MKKLVLDVGNCVPDHAAICRFLQRNFDVQVQQAHDAAGALAALHAGPVDLVLVNRKLDQDYSDGLDVIRQIKADPRVGQVPVMLITNYAEYQEQAVAEGAVRGFGKLDLQKPGTAEQLRPLLGAAPVDGPSARDAR